MRFSSIALLLGAVCGTLGVTVPASKVVSATKAIKNAKATKLLAEVKQELVIVNTLLKDLPTTGRPKEKANSTSLKSSPSAPAPKLIRRDNCDIAVDNIFFLNEQIRAILTQLRNDDLALDRAHQRVLQMVIRYQHDPRRSIGRLRDRAIGVLQDAERDRAATRRALREPARRLTASWRYLRETQANRECNLPAEVIQLIQREIDYNYIRRLV